MVQNKYPYDQEKFQKHLFSLKVENVMSSIAVKSQATQYVRTNQVVYYYSILVVKIEYDSTVV